MTWMKTAIADLAQISVMSNDVTRDLDRLRQKVDDTHKHTATKLDDLIYHLKQAAENGDAVAQSVLDVVQGVQNGIIPTLAAINAFGDATTVIDGHVRSLRDLLSDLLPQMGDAQNMIADTIAGIHDYDSAIEALRETNNGLALSFADLVEAFRDGKVSIDELIRAAEAIKHALPGGSGPSQLADAILSALQNGRF